MRRERAGTFLRIRAQTRATGDANFCASTSETSDGRRGVTCASVCDAARAPEVFEVREAEEGVGGVRDGFARARERRDDAIAPRGGGTVGRRRR